MISLCHSPLAGVPVHDRGTHMQRKTTRIVFGLSTVLVVDLLRPPRGRRLDGGRSAARGTARDARAQEAQVALLLGAVHVDRRAAGTVGDGRAAIGTVNGDSGAGEEPRSAVRSDEQRRARE